MVKGTVSVKKKYAKPRLDIRSLNENGVIFLFSKVAEDLDITIEGIQVKFPDAFGKWYERPRALSPLTLFMARLY